MVLSRRLRTRGANAGSVEQSSRCTLLVHQQGAALLFTNRRQAWLRVEEGGGWRGATETQKLIAGKEDGNKSSRKANVENAVLVYV